jgi:hypothetical protein
VSVINIAIEISSFEMRNNLGQLYKICIMGEFNRSKIGEGHQGWRLVGCDGWYSWWGWVVVLLCQILPKLIYNNWYILTRKYTRS